jgi:hypothetical protein
VDPFPLSHSAGFLFIYLSFYFANFVFFFFSGNKQKSQKTGRKNMTGGKCDGTSNECFIAPHTPRLLLLLGMGISHGFFTMDETRKRNKKKRPNSFFFPFFSQ